MTAVGERAGSAPRRPRNRKAKIADAAAGLFCGLGYHRVGIDDIAASVGITGRAIYRHFDNKQELLAHTVLDGVAMVEAAIEDRGTAGLDPVLRALAALATDRRELGVLLQRESRHLSRPAQAELNRRLGVVAGAVRALLRSARPELSEEDAGLVTRSAFALLASPAYHRAVLPRPRAEDLLHAMGAAVFWTATFPRPGGAGAGAADEGEPAVTSQASRREMLLSAAIHLFARRGYSAVRMEDVGAAVGIAGPSIYQHFGSKSDLLVAALSRGAEWLQFGMSRALAIAATPLEALERVVRSYVEFVLGHTDLMGIFLGETINLPESEQHSLRRVQHDYVAQWVNVLTEARPGLPEPEARFLTHGVLGIVNDNAQGDAAQRRADLEETLVELGYEVLTRTGRPVSMTKEAR